MYVVKVFSYEPEMMMMRWKAVLGKTKQARLGLRINSQTVGKSLSVPNTGWLGPKYYVSLTLQLCSLRPPPTAAVLLLVLLLQSHCIWYIFTISQLQIQILILSQILRQFDPAIMLTLATTTTSCCSTTTPTTITLYLIDITILQLQIQILIINTCKFSLQLCSLLHITNNISSMKYSAFLLVISITDVAMGWVCGVKYHNTHVAQKVQRKMWQCLSGVLYITLSTVLRKTAADIRLWVKLKGGG